MRIIIVDDHPLVRQGLSSLLSFERDLKLVGESENIEEALIMIDEKNPDLALVDLMLGKENGLEIVTTVRKYNSKCKFIILTSSANYQDFIMAEQCHVDGYVLKEALPEELLYAIRIVSRGKKYFDPVLLEHKLTQSENLHTYSEDLTPRETEVLKELSKGLNNRQISERLYISENTVKKHVSQILSKLDFNDRTQAALYASNIELRHIV